MNLATRWMATCLIAAGTLSLTGCGSSDQIVSQSQKQYDSGDYATAYEVSHQVADNPARSSAERQQAAYLAGISAVKMRRGADAEHYLLMAVETKDPKLAGNANAQLGLLYTAMEKYDKGADYLVKAADNLQGQDKANAYFFAGVAQDRSGHWPQAKTNLSMAKSLSTDEGFRRRVDDEMRLSGYTLQFGAFTKEDHARKAVDRISNIPGTHKYGSPRVVNSTDPKTGQPLYIVQLGNFMSLPTAQDAWQELRPIMTGKSDAAIISPVFVK